MLASILPFLREVRVGTFLPLGLVSLSTSTDDTTKSTEKLKLRSTQASDTLFAFPMGGAIRLRSIKHSAVACVTM